jgi:hypothetical protein
MMEKGTKGQGRIVNGFVFLLWFVMFGSPKSRRARGVSVGQGGTYMYNKKKQM